MVNKIEFLVVDTTAFINNAPLHEIADNIITIQEVIDEITNKRQLRRLVVLPYDLKIKDVFPENLKAVIDFSKKTGDYPSLSATDLKVMALAYQLEKEKVGTSHLRQQPVVAPTVNIITAQKPKDETPTNISGFYLPEKKAEISDDSSDDDDTKSEESDSQSEGEYELSKPNYEFDEELEDNASDDQQTQTQVENEDKLRLDGELSEKFATLNCGPVEDEIEGKKLEDILAAVPGKEEPSASDGTESDSESGYSDDAGWITPGNVQKAKKQMNDEFVEDKPATVACITTDFAMQNVLKQMNLNVAALDGRMIKQIRTFILRCYTCFKTTSLMEKVFCPKCGHKTLKKVAVSVDSEGKQKIHINARKPLTARGKKFSLPTFKGGKHSKNPILSEDQPRPQQRPTRQARMKNNPLDPDYIAGYSPFVMRDVNSKSALLGIRPGEEVKYWMRKNPNETRRKRK